jgi:Heparan-alpha-glucosaminide N-acetyltransferase, catalytic
MTNGGKNSVEQLDFLRGIAISMMIVNHVGERLLDQTAQATSFLAASVFIGSFAPVVFFFTTGFGIGFAKRAINLAAFLSTLLKAALLVVADQFMFWRTSTPWGLDFLGFIAISSVLVTSLAASKKSMWLCAVLMLGVLAVRFGLGSWSRERLDLPGTVTWLIGARGIDGISYPFSPWIFYPLLGFLIGRGYNVEHSSLTSFPRPWLYLATVGAFVSAYALDRTNAVFFRWGTMSFAYFVLSVGVLFQTLIIAWKVADHAPRVAQILSLRGISSLAIVPIHYALIEIVARLDSTAIKAIAAALTVMIVIMASSVILSRAFATRVEIWISSVSPGLASVPLACLVTLCAAICWWFPTEKSTVRFAAFVVGQLAIAALLVVRNRKSSPSLITKPALS